MIDAIVLSEEGAAVIGDYSADEHGGDARYVGGIHEARGGGTVVVEGRGCTMT